MKADGFIKQLEAIASEHKAMASQSQHKDLSDLPKNDRQALVTKAVAAVVRISGPRSTYSADIEKIRHNSPTLHVHMTSVLGVADALLSDLKAGYVDSLTELAHADLFADFLDMAQHLLDEKYKDASAVIAGSSPLSANISETPTFFEISVEGGGDNHGTIRSNGRATGSERGGIAGSP